MWLHQKNRWQSLENWFLMLIQAFHYSWFRMKLIKFKRISHAIPLTSRRVNKTESKCIKHPWFASGMKFAFCNNTRLIFSTFLSGYETSSRFKRKRRGYQKKRRGRWWFGWRSWWRSEGSCREFSWEEEQVSSSSSYSCFLSLSPWSSSPPLLYPDHHHLPSYKKPLKKQDSTFDRDFSEFHRKSSSLVKSTEADTSRIIMNCKWIILFVTLISLQMTLTFASTKRKKNEEETKENSINYYYTELMHRPGHLLTSMVHDFTLPVFVVMGVASLASVLTNVSVTYLTASSLHSKNNLCLGKERRQWYPWSKQAIISISGMDTKHLEGFGKCSKGHWKVSTSWGRDYQWLGWVSQEGVWE